MIGVGIIKMFFIDIDGVVLLHAPLYPGNQRFHCVLIVFVFFDFLTETFNIALLGEVDILGPPSFNMPHAGTYSSFNSCIYLCLVVMGCSVHSSDSRIA